MKKLLSMLALGTLLLVGCDKDSQHNADDDVVDIVEDFEYENTTSSLSVFFADEAAVPSYIAEALHRRFPVSASDADSADVVFVTSQGLAANSQTVEKAWQKGCSVVELMPQNALHNDFWHSIGALSFLDPAAADNDLMLIAVNGATCYQLQDPLAEGVLAPDDGDDEEDESADSESSERGDANYDVLPVAVGQTAEFIATKLGSLVQWCDDMAEPGIETGNTGEVPTFDGDLSKRILDQQYSQHITKTVAVGATGFQLCKVKSSSPDKVTRHSQVDIDIYVTPLYSYELNGEDKRGDYYFITMSVVSHNKELYALYKKWHGLIRTWAHAFYSKNINWTASLLTSDHASLADRLSFFETPKPESTASSTSYTTGFTTALNISGQGGVSNGKPSATLTVGTTFTWSHSQSRSVKDQSVEMSTDPATRSVHFDYLTNNLQEEDATDKAVPAIARTDQKCEASWCWRVGDTKDDDNSTRFALKLNFDPIYGWMYRHATWTVEGHKKTTHLLAEKDREMYFEILNPDRTRNGVLELKSTNSNYMTDVKVINAAGFTVKESEKAMERNLIQRFQLPVGTYSVEFTIQDGDTGEVKGEYVISNVEIETAKTTEKSSLDGKKKQ